MGLLNFGRNLPTSMLNINKILIMVRITKAIGDTIDITFVKETFRIVVNIKPSKNIKNITPKDINIPNKAKDFLDSVPCSLFERNAKNPGYNGRTHTAVNGVSNPKTKDVDNSVIKPTI